MRPRIPHRWKSMLVLGCVGLWTSCEEVSVTAVDVASVTLAPDEGTIAQGDTLRLQVTLQDAAGNRLAGRPVEWVIDRPEVAELDANGLVRGLTEGTATVRASSEGAMGEASITVLEGPVIALSDDQLDFQSRSGAPPTDTRSVEISNGGAGVLAGLRVSVIHPGGEPAGWLEAGLLGTSSPTSLLLRANPGALTPGQFHAQVHVIADHAANSPQVIDVSFDVDEEAPAIHVDPRALGFSMSQDEGPPASQTVAVTNAGAGDLTDLDVDIWYAEGEATGWLDAELAGTTAPTQLTLRVDPEGLDSPVLLEGEVRITSPTAPGSTGVVSVRFRLGEPSPELGPCRDLDELRADLLAIEGANPGSDLADDIEDVRQKVEDAYAERCLKEPADRKSAARKIEDAVKDLVEIVDDGLMDASQAEDFLDRLLGVSRTMAGEAIEAAEDRDASWIRIVRAYSYIAQGDRLWEFGAYEDAAASYRDAISRAEGA